MVWNEVAICSARINHRLATEAVVNHAVQASFQSKEGSALFQKTLRRLTNGE